MKKTVKVQGGVTVTGDAIRVTESIERYSELTLEDGAVIRIKATASEALRVDDMKDEDGNPVYHLKIHTVIGLLSPPAQSNTEDDHVNGNPDPNDVSSTPEDNGQS